jgi:hypothetical protein
MKRQYELSIHWMYDSEINRLLRRLDLPEEECKSSQSEEELFLRQYDIKTFGCSNDQNISSLWFEKEYKSNHAFNNVMMI